MELLDLFLLSVLVSFLGGAGELSAGVQLLVGLDATDAQATHAAGMSGGGRQIWLARVLRFCTMAARWNSSRAPERPRSRIRSKRWWVFRCAKRISTFLRSSRDLSNSGVPINARVQHRGRPR